MKVIVSFKAEISDNLMREGSDIALSIIDEHVRTLLEGREYDEQQIFGGYEDLEIEPQETEEDIEREYFYE